MVSELKDFTKIKDNKIYATVHKSSTRSTIVYVFSPFGGMYKVVDIPYEGELVEDVRLIEVSTFFKRMVEFSKRSNCTIYELDNEDEDLDELKILLELVG